MYNPFTLANKTILVTGASSGIGKSIAIECSKMGATLFITGRDHERLNETYTLLQGNGHRQIAADLQQEDMISTLVQELPALHGVVHSAGINTIQLFPFIAKKQLDTVFSINFIAPSILSQQIIKHKKLYKNASVIFISSISGVYCSAVGTSMYSASKGALNGLVKGMALDLAPKGIRVNCINPGVVETNIFSEGTLSEEQLHEEKKKYPLKRYGKPEEIAHAAIYLLSDASLWITGSNLVIDGGYTLQ